MSGKKHPKLPPAAPAPNYARIPLDRILEPELPARAQMDDHHMTDLIESMRAVGQIVPVTVEKHEGMYELITGHRRFLAARTLAWPDLAAIVYAEGSALKLAQMAHENAMREPLNPAEEAIWMAQAQEQLKLDEAGLVNLFKRSADYIAGRLALLRGDPDVFGAVQRGEISLGVAHQLNRVTEEGMRRYYLDAARRTSPPARVVGQWVTDWKSQQAALAPLGTSGAPAEGSLTAGEGQPLAGDGAGAAVPGSAPAVPAPFFGCALCGGDRDPYNLVNVTVHRWEWEMILKQVEKAAKGLES